MAVTFNQHVDIDAAPEALWALICDATKWPLWIGQLEQISGIGEAVAGANFQWTHGTTSGTGAVLSVDGERYILKLATRLGDDERNHTFDIDRAGGFLGFGAKDSRLRYTYSYETAGGVLGEFVAGGNPADSLLVKNTLQKIKKLAEDSLRKS